MSDKIEESQDKRRRIPVPATVAIIWIGIYLFLKLFFTYYIQKPLPSSIIFMYMATVTVGLVLAVSIFEHILEGFTRPIIWFLNGDTVKTLPWRVARWAVLILIPVYIGNGVYQRTMPRFDPPISSRVIHPAPPPEVSAFYNELRDDEENLKQYIEEGRVVYYQNCFFCHGDAWDGEGHFAYAINPVPSNFQDSGTIAQLTESFVFWRISTGGPGLPDESTPWDSFMPRWETMLTEEERWKVILYMYDATGWSPRTWGEEEETAEEPVELAAEGEEGTDDFAAGREIYEKYCSQCHGENGAGDGPAAEFMSPRPRDFTQGLFKIRSTPSGQLPTDEDLFQAVSDGMPGTAMIGWTKYLDEKKRKQVIQYVKTFFSQIAEQKGASTPMKIGEPTPTSPESIAKGKELYKKLNCLFCHGTEGRGSGPMVLSLRDAKGFPILPANLTRNWDFRGGHRPEDIYSRINGGIASTPMPAHAKLIDEKESWDLVNYVLSLSPKQPPVGQVLKAKLVEGELPQESDDPRWEEAELSEYPLVPQIVEDPRIFASTVNAVRAQALFNDKEIAIRLTWDDRTQSRLNPKLKTFEDAIALQFPVKIPTGARKPYFLMGDSDNPVNLWRWGSENADVVELNANGSDSQQTQAETSQGVQGGAKFNEGQYRIVMKRDLTTADNDLDIQFQPGKFIPMSFFVWDGSNNETGKQMAMSRWYYVMLEPTISATVYLYPFVAILLAGGAEWWLLWRIRKNKGTEQ